MVKTVQHVRGGLANPAASKEVFEHMVAEQEHEPAAAGGGDRFKAAFRGPDCPAGDCLDMRMQIQAVLPNYAPRGRRLVTLRPEK
jgi:hypothetical protein